MTDRDPVCGCKIETLQGNRRDRRRARRQRIIAATHVTIHRPRCPRAGVTASRSDPARDKPQRREET